MIKMRMCDEHMIDQSQFVKAEIGHAGACVDQDILVDKH